MKSNLTAHVSTARPLAGNVVGRLSPMAVWALVVIVALPISPPVAAQASSTPLITSVSADHCKSAHAHHQRRGSGFPWDHHRDARPVGKFDLGSVTNPSRRQPPDRPAVAGQLPAALTTAPRRISSMSSG